MNNRNLRTDPMDMTYIEHQTAPRLEQDIHGFFAQIRNISPDPKFDKAEYSREVMDQSAKILLAYFLEWNFLMFSLRDSDCSFWIMQFKKAYFATLQEEKLGKYYFRPNGVHTEQWMIQLILYKLKSLFNTTGFIEELRLQNDAQDKQISRLEDAYLQMGKTSIEAPDLRFYLSYPAGTELLQTIDQVVRSFQAFEKKLKYQPWFQAQVIFSYYHLIRDSYRNCYVIRFFLTFQKALYSTHIDYSGLLLRLWQEATYDIGELLTISNEEFQESHTNPFGFGCEDIVEFPEPQNAFEDLSDLPKQVSCVEEKMNKICIVPRGGKIFDGKKW